VCARLVMPRWGSTEHALSVSAFLASDAAACSMQRAIELAKHGRFALLRGAGDLGLGALLNSRAVLLEKSVPSGG
jgi:hypothetical protein